MNKVFIINGMARAGKDTFCKFVSEFYPNTYHFSIVDSVKRQALQLGWDGVKDEKGRKFLNGLKNIIDEYNDNNFKEIVEKVNNTDDTNKVFLIDMRELSDIERARKELNASIVLINNENVEQIKSNNADANVYNISYDIVIDNSGSLDELKDKAQYFVNKYIKE